MGFILWRMDPFLGTDLETNNETTVVAIQQRRKHSSTVIELLLVTVFSVWSVLKICLQDNLGDPVSCQLRVQFCTGGFEDRT
jgi:hypothetical protein